MLLNILACCLSTYWLMWKLGKLWVGEKEHFCHRPVLCGKGLSSSGGLQVFRSRTHCSIKARSDVWSSYWHNLYKCFLRCWEVISSNVKRPKALNVATQSFLLKTQAELAFLTFLSASWKLNCRKGLTYARMPLAMARFWLSPRNTGEADRWASSHGVSYNHRSLS